MARFAAFVAICATVCMVSVSAMSPLDYGITMTTKAMQGACWYEFLKRLPEAPETRSKDFGKCYPNADIVNIQEQFAKQGFEGEDAKPSLVNAIRERINKLPASTGYSGCTSYLDDTEKLPAATFSELKDGDNKYPFKGFSHCIVSKLKETYGKDAVDALGEKWKYKSIPWQKVINERENENRARHGAGELAMDKELTVRAQRWADNLAKNCRGIQLSDHINKEHPDYKYREQPTGESISQSSSKYISEDNALSAADSWYEEARDYPWPSYTGSGSDQQFLKIGHFTAQVWKGSQRVGYGLGRRDGCDKVYVVARYWPSGNWASPNKFAANVGEFNG